MIAWAVENMILASVAMLLVLALRRPVARWLGAGTAYALWLLPPLRLLAPPGQWLPAAFGTALPAFPPLVLFDAPAATAPLPPLGGPGQWVPILLAVWAGGAVFLLAYQFVRYRNFLRQLSLSLVSAGSHQGLPLLRSEAVDGPLALGLLDRRIVVPADFTQRYSPAERALALDHEAYHHRRRDLLANHVALLVLALNWFNPIAWFAFRAFRGDQELSCDSAVTAGASADQRVLYARALIKSASQPGLIAACPLNRADQLKWRLKMLNHHSRGRTRRAAGLAVTAALTAGTLALGSPSHAQQGSAAPKEGDRIIIMNRVDGSPARAGEDVTRHLSPDIATRIRNCRDGNDQLADVEAGSGRDRTRVLLCAMGDGTPQGRLQALERVRDRLANERHLSAETRQRVIRQLEEAIARARQ